MPSRPWYPKYPGDYLADTAMLSLEAHGFYNLMLDYLWLNDGSLPADHSKLAKLLRLDVRVLRRQLLGECSTYFYETSGEIRNKRVDKELLKSKVNHEVLSAAGKAGAEARLGALAKQDHIPDTRIEELPKGNLSGKARRPAASLEAKNAAKRVLDFLNEKTGRAYRPLDVNLDLIVARIREGYDEDMCRAVIARKCREWLGDDKMAKYLRPATLFKRMNFSQYAGECVE